MGITSLALFKLVSGGIGKVPKPAEGEKKPRKSFLSYFSPYVFIAILSSFVVLFADGARTTFYPVLLRDFGYSATIIGLYMSIRGFVSMTFRFFMGRLVRLAGGTFPALIASLFILAAGIGTTPFCRGAFMLTANAVLVGIGLGMALPLSMATVSEGTNREDRGVAMGIRLTGNRLAQLINPVFFGTIAQGFGLAASFVSGGIMLFGSTLPILFWWRGEKHRRREGRF
jgi:MFS family permease